MQQNAFIQNLQSGYNPALLDYALQNGFVRWGSNEDGNPQLMQGSTASAFGEGWENNAMQQYQQSAFPSQNIGGVEYSLTPGSTPDRAMANPADLAGVPATLTPQEVMSGLASAGVNAPAVAGQNGGVYAPTDALQQAAAVSNQGGLVQNLLNGPGPILAAMGGVGALGVLGAGAGAGALSGGAGTGSLAGGIGADTLGAGFASDAGFLPGSFELGASGYGGTAAAGLDAAAAAAGGAGGLGGGILDTLTQMPPGTGTVLQQALGGAPEYGQLTGPLTTGAEGGLATTAPAAAGTLTGPATTAAGAGLAGLTGAGGLAEALSGGAGPVNPGFNLLDPSTYGGSSSGGGITDWLSQAFPNANMGSLLQGGLQGVLGYLGSQQQTGALKDMQDKYLALGAPYRDMLAQTYQPGYSVFNDSATKDAATRAADVAARSYSATAGNPFDNPGAQSGIYNSVLSGVALPQLNTNRSQLGSFGQLGLNTAGTAGLGAASQAGGGMDAIGYGIGTALNGQPNIQDILKQFGGMQNQYRLSY